MVWCKEGKNVDKLVFPWQQISRKSKTTDDWAFWPSFYSVAYVYLIIHMTLFNIYVTYIRWSVARVASGLWCFFNGAVPAVNSICLIRSDQIYLLDQISIELDYFFSDILALLIIIALYLSWLLSKYIAFLDFLLLDKSFAVGQVEPQSMMITKTISFVVMITAKG